MRASAFFVFALRLHRGLALFLLQRFPAALGFGQPRFEIFGFVRDFLALGLEFLRDDFVRLGLELVRLLHQFLRLVDRDLRFPHFG